MGIFSDVTKLGAAAGRQKVASFQKQANDMMYMSPEEELSWAEQHPMLAGAGRALATGAGGALGHAAGTFGLGRFGMSHPAMAYAMPGVGAGLGAAGANYLAGGDGLSAGMAGLGAAAGSAGGLAYHQRAGAKNAPIPTHQHWGSGAAAGGAAASAATDAVRGKKKKKDDDEKNSNDMYMSPEEELSWAQQHPALAGIGRAAATGAGGALGSWGTNALMGRFAPGFMARNPNWSSAINAAGTGLSAAGANYAAGGDAMSAGVSGLGAAGGMYALNHGGLGYLNAKQKQIDAGKIDAAGQAALVNRANMLGNLNHYGAGAAAGGALASGAYDALSGEKVSNEEPTRGEGPSFAQRHPVLAGNWRNFATGTGGMLANAGTGLLLGRYAPGFSANRPGLTNVIQSTAGGLGAAGANYLTGGDSTSALATGITGGLGGLAGGYVSNSLGKLVPDEMRPYASAMMSGGGASAGATTADAISQFMGH